VKLALGDTKKILKNERPILQFARESVVTKCEIKKNEIFSENNITTKRPSTGKIPAKDFFRIIGKKAKRGIPKLKQISYEDIF
jgi:N,N'-diacetyllegionaminate synthase